MAKKATVVKKAPKSSKESLIAYTGKNWSLEKDGLVIRLVSGTGFYADKQKDASVKLKITVEEV